MFRCRICQFDVLLDDVLVQFPSGACVCLGCFARAIDRPPMPPLLRRQLMDALATTV